MPDGQSFMSPVAGAAQGAGQPAYVPPLKLLLDGLGITALQFGRPTVAVSSAFLRFLISELARFLPFDAQFYAREYPDVESARLAGDIPDLHAHFVTIGYFEQRQPCAMPFDASYYHTSYRDLAAAFDRGDLFRLHAHFRAHGWQEGRVGVDWQRAASERWLAAVRATPDA